MSTRILSVEDVDGEPLVSSQWRQAGAAVGSAVGVTASLGSSSAAAAAVSPAVDVSASVVRTQPAAASVGVAATLTADATPTRVGAASVSTTASLSASAQLMWQYGFNESPAPGSWVTRGGVSFSGGVAANLVTDPVVNGTRSNRLVGVTPVDYGGVTGYVGTSADFIVAKDGQTGPFWLSCEVVVTELRVPISVFLVSNGASTFGGDVGAYYDYNRGYTVVAGLIGSAGTFGTTPGIFVGTMTHQDNPDLGNDPDLFRLDASTTATLPGGVWPTDPIRLEFQWSPDTNTGIQIKAWLDASSTGAPDAVATSLSSWAPDDPDGDPWPLSPRVGASSDTVGWAVGARGSDEFYWFAQPFLNNGDTFEYGAVGYSADTWVGPWR